MAGENKKQSNDKNVTVQLSSGTEGLDVRAVVAACMNSERSSCTVDLSSGDKIERFVVAAKSFHPQLVGLLNEWATGKNQTQLRDRLQVNGQSASTLMEEQGKTFLDVICDAQRSLDGDPRKLPQIEVLSANKDEVKPLVPHPPERPQLNRLQRFANFITRGGYEQRLLARTETERREALETAPANPEQNRKHNKDILAAEQVVKTVMQEQQEVQKAADILGERRQEILRMQEKRAAYIDSFMEREKENPGNQAMPSKEQRLAKELATLSGQLVNRQGAMTTVDISTKAMAVAEVELSCIDEMLGNIKTDNTKMSADIQRSEQQLASMRQAVPAQVGQMGSAIQEPMTVQQCSEMTQTLVAAVRQTGVKVQESRINADTYDEVARCAEKMGSQPAPRMGKNPMEDALREAKQDARKFIMDDVVQDVSIRASQMAQSKLGNTGRERVKLSELAPSRVAEAKTVKTMQPQAEKTAKAL